MAIQKKTYIDFLGSPEPEVHIAHVGGGTGVAAGTDNLQNQWMFANGACLEIWHGETSALIVPVKVAGVGLDISLDAVDNDQCEIIVADSLNSTGPCYTIGTDAAFRFDVKMLLDNVSGYSPVAVGFRKQAAFEDDTPTFANWKAAYDDKAAIGPEGTATADIEIYHSLNGSDATVDTTDNWADAATKTLSVLVSAAGVVTYLIDGVAPTVTLAHTFDSGDIVIPFIACVGQESTSPVTLISWFSGHQ